MARLLGVVALACAVARATPAWPAPPPPPVATIAGATASEVTEPAPPEEEFTVTFGNRPIAVFRTRVLGRTPEDRATVVVRRLDELADQGLTAPVASRLMGGIAVLTVAGREAVTILPTDLDPLAGETMEGVTRQAVASLARAMAEVAEARSPTRLLYAGLRALGATAVAVLLALGLAWARRRGAARARAWIDRHLAATPAGSARGEIWRTTEAMVVGVLQFLGRLLSFALGILLAYAWLTFVLRQFPYTRPWGEALRSFVLDTVLRLGAGMVAAVPGLFTVALVVLITRFVSRIVNVLFRAVELGRISLPGVYPDTAPPTRRLVVALLWLFAVVVAYPYLPGSGTDAFKGVSVFVGLIISLGSSGLVNQAMSSFMITYSRALKLGDYVRIGEVEGTVVLAGLLATKVRTRRNEEITFPNAVVASTTITNYSRHAVEGVFVRTSITIGYDTPWRQVEAMLLEAASRTRGVRAEPPPRVLQVGLQDFYVEYALVLVPERPEERLAVLSELHGHIQDAFNENGVQIMSPHYEADPAGPKVVPKAQWFAPPARPRPGE